jgi:hypothetical protein
MPSTFIKKFAITSVLMLAGTGTALAGGDKNCDHKKKAKQTSAMITTDAAGHSEVLGTSEKSMTVQKAKKVMSFDDAMKLCRDKGAEDLKACIDYKTGATKTYKKSTS